jgi:hypothetical protein
MKIDESLFDKEAFKKWLEGKPDKSIVGQSGIACMCPLAMWIREMGFRVEVGSDKRALVVDGSVPMFKPVEKIINLPTWASNFVRLIDHPTDVEDVSKEEALDALERCRMYALLT